MRKRLKLAEVKAEAIVVARADMVAEEQAKTVIERLVKVKA